MPPESEPGHRRLVLITGSAPTARATAARYTSGARPLWISDAPPSAARSLPPGRARDALGSDETAVVFDLFSGLDVDALAASSGLVRGGGAFIVAAPPLREWSRRSGAPVSRRQIQNALERFRARFEAAGFGPA